MKVLGTKKEYNPEVFKQLVKEAKNNREKCNELIVLCLPLIYKLVKSKNSRFFNENFEDIIQSQIIYLYKAIDTYDESKNTKFTTWAVYWLKSAISNYQKKNIKIPDENIVPLECAKHVPIPECYYSDSVINKIFAEKVLRMLTVEERNIVEKIIGIDCECNSFQQVASNLGVSKIRVCQIYNQAIRKIRMRLGISLKNGGKS